MFEPGDVVYAFIKDIHPPKPKYLVTLYRDDNLRVVACFTTTKIRMGIPPEQLKHGYVRREGMFVGYFFDRNVCIGINPVTKEEFRFPKDCIIPFDYCMQVATLEEFISRTEGAELKCKLNQSEYFNLVYSLYKSPMINQKYKPYLEKILDASPSL